MNNEASNPLTSPESPLRFGLRQVFYATALIASGLAFSPDTIWLSLVVLTVWGIVFSSSRPWITLGMLLIPLIVLSAFWPKVQVSREAPRFAVCHNNLKNIIMAALIYESEKGHFPTDRIVVLDDGTELRHSWRIEILPFLEQSAMYAAYDFKEPWNGPKNSTLESSMPEIFSSPGRHRAPKTAYKLVNGPGTAFEIGKNVGDADVNDGLSNTIGLIEDPHHPTHWMQPGEFTAEEAAEAMNSMAKEAAVHHHETTFNKTYFGSGFATLDGATHWWPPNSDKPMQPGAFLIDDGYLFDTDALGKPVVKIKYGAWFRLAVYLMLILLPVFFLRGTRRHQIRQNSRAT